MNGGAGGINGGGAIGAGINGCGAIGGGIELIAYVLYDATSGGNNAQATDTIEVKILKI